MALCSEPALVRTDPVVLNGAAVRTVRSLCSSMSDCLARGVSILPSRPDKCVAREIRPLWLKGS